LVTATSRVGRVGVSAQNGKVRWTLVRLEPSQQQWTRHALVMGAGRCGPGTYIQHAQVTTVYAGDDSLIVDHTPTQLMATDSGERRFKLG